MHPLQLKQLKGEGKKSMRVFHKKEEELGKEGGKPASIPEQWFFKCVIKLKEQQWNNIYELFHLLFKESQLTLKRFWVSSSFMKSNNTESKMKQKIEDEFWNLRPSNLLFVAQTIFFYIITVSDTFKLRLTYPEQKSQNPHEEYKNTVAHICFGVLLKFCLKKSHINNWT